VTCRPRERGDLQPEAAARFADEKLVVLVENRVSDGAFLKRIIEAMGGSLRTWWSRSGDPACIDSLGGRGEMRKEVEARARSVPRPRLVVIVDSDRRGPDEPAHDEARQLERRCTQLGFPCWVLAKRESENYLPQELLEQRPDAGISHQQCLEAWCELDDDQKDFYDMKKGLSEDPGEAERRLFAGVGDRNREKLAGGFGSSVWVCWSQYQDQKRVRDGVLRRGRSDIERGLSLILREV
jgi:hypothetical protein